MTVILTHFRKPSHCHQPSL